MLFLSTVCLISACGLKGDLYLPEAQPQEVGSNASDNQFIETPDEEPMLEETIYSQDEIGIGTPIEIDEEQESEDQSPPIELDH